MSYYYTLEVLEKGVYCFEQFDKSNCTSLEWVIHEDCFMDLSNPTEQEIEMHDMLSFKSNGLSMPPQDVWPEFLFKLNSFNIHSRKTLDFTQRTAVTDSIKINH